MKKIVVKKTVCGETVEAKDAVEWDTAKDAKKNVTCKKCLQIILKENR
jgi:hypothetical protein